MRRLILPLLLVPALAAGGCTSSGSSSSSAKFSGAEADVADAVAELQKAGQRKDGGKICSDLLARAAVQDFGGAAKCKDEVEKAITDSDEFSLEVRDVVIEGPKATAKVRQGKTGTTKAVTFVKEGNLWKVTGLSNG